ncbi:MAG: exodeoxyribonuclease VII small subunit [Pseudomonadota bacterium]
MVAKKIDLDKALTELESIVEALEGGDLALDEAMKKFERGVRLTRDCQDALVSAEQKVSVLLEQAGLTGEPVDLEVGDDD